MADRLEPIMLTALDTDPFPVARRVSALPAAAALLLIIPFWGHSSGKTNGVLVSHIYVLG